MALQGRELSRIVSVRGEIHALLQEVSIHVEPGRVTGVTGPSGSGKTTLLRLLLGLDARSGGQVLLDGEAVLAVHLPRVRRQAIMVPQALPAPTGTPAASLAAVRRLGVYGEDGTKEALPRFERHAADLGLAPAASERRWQDLSGGERRRMWIALAAAVGPRFLVLDEPSEGLDARASGRLARWVRARAAEGTGLLVVSHDELLLARTADTMLVLYDGRVQGVGVPGDLIPAAVAAAERERDGT